MAPAQTLVASSKPRKPLTWKAIAVGIIVAGVVGIHGFLILMMLGFGLAATQGYSGLQRLGYAFLYLAPFAAYAFATAWLWFKSRYGWALLLAFSPIPLISIAIEAQKFL